MRRQQRKLNFLITQTELYAHFMARKMNTHDDGDDDATEVILERLDDTSSSRIKADNVLVDMVADDYGKHI